MARLLVLRVLIRQQQGPRMLLFVLIVLLPLPLPLVLGLVQTETGTGSGNVRRILLRVSRLSRPAGRVERMCL